MLCSDTKNFLKRMIITNLGFAMFGTPIAILFLQTIQDTSILNGVGVVFVFFTVFITMFIGLDLIITGFRSLESREGK